MRRRVTRVRSLSFTGRAIALALTLFACNDASDPGGPSPEAAAEGLSLDRGGRGNGHGTGNANAGGAWAPPFSTPIVALHLNLLPDGRVLTWGHAGVPYIWNPENGTFSAAPSPVLLFCAGHAFLPDGRLFVTGGHQSDHIGLRAATIFDYRTNTWSSSSQMARGRWYPTNTVLPNGDVLTMSGNDDIDGSLVRVHEVWSATGNSWRQLTGAEMELPSYPRTFVAPNGKVFYAGEALATGYIDPAGAGQWQPLGFRSGGTEYGSAVMYEPGKVLYTGGGWGPTSISETIDLSEPAPAWRPTAPMSVPRKHHTATMLPTGEVLVTGGTRGEGFNNEAAAELSAEIWTPGTGMWRTLASARTPRAYHGAALLLQDGRVLFAGGGDASGAIDHRDAEIFSPPYLSLGKRPKITSGPVSASYGQTIRVGTKEANKIASVSLIRLGSVTHAFDQNQRFASLSFRLAGAGLEVTMPASANLAPPGHYMLFVVSGDGVPSVAHVLRIG